MAWCVIVPSHYLNLCWLIINGVLQIPICESSLKKIHWWIQLLLHLPWANNLRHVFISNDNYVFVLRPFRLNLHFWFYSGRTPKHHCTVPHGFLINESIPIDQETGALHKCIMYTGNSTNVTTSCDHGWTYDNVDGDYTIVNEVITVTRSWRCSWF